MESKYKLVYTPSSRADLLFILDYIAEDDMDVAFRYVSKLERIIGGLKDHPYKGVNHPDPNLRLKGYRVLLIDSYCVYYKPVESTKTCTIYRILNVYMDHTDLLN